MGIPSLGRVAPRMFALGNSHFRFQCTAPPAIIVQLIRARSFSEGDFLLDLHKGFRGVLVTDFYAAYDSLDCAQQKCLIHLMRDMNQELLSNPFDQDLQSITGPFGTLLREIVATID